jgi:restriction system protein
MTLWLVRAGRYGEREQFATEKNLAVIGWEEMPDLSKLKTRDELTDLLAYTYPDEKKRALSNWEAQLWAFSNRMQVGDLVAMPLKHRAIIKFGYVTGKYKYEPTNPVEFKHTRPVNWKHEIPRNKIDQDLLYALGAANTVCSISRKDAENRFKAILSEKPTVTGKPVPDSDIEAEESVNLEQLARDQISDAINRNFKGHKLAHLTAAVLQAQGYKLRISPEGPDGGVDIIAGKGPLGFESPRLVVQVKSGDSPVNVRTVRELNGVIDTFGAESGLIVAWGGFQGQVDKEAARQYFKIRLWDANDLVQMIQENYDNLSESIQSDLPLKRIWILLPENEE